MDEDDGIDIRDEINFQFDSEYQIEKESPQIEIEDEDDFYIEGEEQLYHNNTQYSNNIRN